MMTFRCSGMRGILRSTHWKRFVLPLYWFFKIKTYLHYNKTYQLGKGKVQALEKGPLRVSVEVTYADLTKTSSLTQVHNFFFFVFDFLYIFFVFDFIYIFFLIGPKCIDFKLR